MEGLDALIVVDSLRMKGAAPGEVRLLRREEILRGPQPDRLSPHDPSLRGALLAAELLGRSPAEVLLVGIVPAETHLGIGLTDAVRNALPEAFAAVVAELARLGLHARYRALVQSPEVWWERQAGPASRRPASPL